jgi:hypothetical protein|tara:strand:- start:62 stop:376 length:315 start_codon:yes stop_codon:yes gene_type:complete
MIRLFLAAIVVSVINACSSWVQVTTEGQGVRLANSNDVSNCTRIGRARSKTLSRVVVIERGGERLQEELLSLARNEAADLGGNVVVPESLIELGEQSFGVYRCP